MNKLFLVLISFYGQFLWAQSPETLFEKARISYDKGSYTQAIELYEKIQKQGLSSSELFFNLGNAHYKNGDIAPCIFYYEKALQLSPNDNEIKNNLSIAKKKNIDHIPSLPLSWYETFFKNISHLFSVNNWGILAIFTMILFVICFLIYYTVQPVLKRQIFFFSSLLFLCISVGSFSIGHSINNNFHNEKYAILFDKEVIVFSEPNPYSTEVTRLHEGTKIQITETLQQWLKIKMENGKIGWIKKTTSKQL